MTKEKAKQIAEVLNAYAEGKPIEVLLDGEWGEITPDKYYFDIEDECYRIKKEPTYRPFKNAKECLEEMQKHQPFGWLRNNKDFSIITAFNNKVIEFQHSNFDFDDILIHGITFADGKPFGIKE